MSAIGVTAVEDGQIVERFYSLVNPETDFAWFNVSLTGITPEMTAGAPTFPQLWTRLEPLLDSGLLVAHNAPFDMGVLAKCLRDYGIGWHARVDYACTCQMGRRCYRDLPNHRLDTLCDYLGIDLRHHDAGSDSDACAAILIDCMARGWYAEQFRRTYDLRQCRTLTGKR